MATVTVTGISSTTTFTASYSNVSDTCTVTVPGPAYSLAFSQNTYTCPMFDTVDISCTLKNGNTPMSGETITLNWQGPIVPVTRTTTTNSSGVATLTFDYFDGEGLFPVTVTATYQGVTATCTIVEG